MKIGKFEFDIKCPACGEIRAVEVVMRNATGDKISIYCSTCGKSSTLTAVAET